MDSRVKTAGIKASRGRITRSNLVRLVLLLVFVLPVAARAALYAVEGVEVNLFTLVAGLDIRRPALKLPGLGRIGVDMIAAPASAR